jgi:phospholipid-translocating ATPase
MTWIVVFPSTLVTMGWIAVYSFFQTSDFIDEVIILFGGIPFWATVFLSVVVALGLYSLLSWDYPDNVQIWRNQVQI